jgi:eukaryotic-like serine/threonine-protein kinase
VAMKVNDSNEAERYHVGITIAGRYRVEQPIGEGPIAAVALARHVSLDEKVAIKFLRPELRRDPVAIARLSRQAKALARIKSDHVARVFDVGITLAVGPYAVMEYLEGTHLGEVLEAEGPLPVERAVEVVLQVCEALTVAHTAGIMHGDIKPQSLFLARHGQFETLKVLDFAGADDERSAKAASSGLPAGELSPAPPLYGTPSYMAPELVRNDSAADHRSDIWSIGVVLHELVTGRALFDGPTPAETCRRVLSDEPITLVADDSVLPPTLRGIIARCLERAPDRRYQSVEELAAALAPLGSMQERFRGRSTGAFSRKLVEEQLALSKTQRLQLPAPSASPPTPGELSTVLADIGAALRWLLRAFPLARVYGRPLWLYGAVAAASALSVVLSTSIFGGIDWVSPPRAAAQNEQLDLREQRSALAIAAPPAPGAPGNIESSSPQPSAAPAPAAAPTMGAAVSPSPAAPAAASESPGTKPGAGTAHPRRRVERLNPHRKRRAAPPVITANDRVDERAAVRRMGLVAERSSRVRLVEGKLVTNRLTQPPVAGSGTDTKPSATPVPEREHGLPDWLELMRRDSDEP